MRLRLEPEDDDVTTLVPAETASAPSLLRSLLVATATVTMLALSLGALYLGAEPPPGSVSAQR